MQTKMYNTQELFLAIKWTALTTFGLLFGNIDFNLASITIQGILGALQPMSWMFTIGAGFMAMRHWYYATKKINDKNK